MLTGKLQSTSHWCRGGKAALLAMGSGRRPDFGLPLAMGARAAAAHSTTLLSDSHKPLPRRPSHAFSTYVVHMINDHVCSLNYQRAPSIPNMFS